MPLTMLLIVGSCFVILKGLEIGRVLRAWPFAPKFKLEGYNGYYVDLRPPFHEDGLLDGLADDSFPQGSVCLYFSHHALYTHYNTYAQTERESARAHTHNVLA